MGESAKTTLDVIPKVALAPVIHDVNVKYQFLPLVSYLSTDGGKGSLDATSNCAIDGSGGVEFYLGPATDCDFYIKRIEIALAGKNPRNDRFCNIQNGLSVGVDLKATQYGNATWLVEKAKTSGELLMFCGYESTAVNGNAPLELASWKKDEDLQTFIINVGGWLDEGIMLQRQSQSKISFIINDDLSTLKYARVRALGKKVYPFEEAPDA